MTAGLDWAAIGAELDREGYAILPRLLEPAQARAFAAAVTVCFDGGDRSDWLPLESLGRGRGHLWRPPGPLPELFAGWRDSFYEGLSPIANRWSVLMGTSARYPATLAGFLRENRAAGQTRDTPSLSCLRQDDYLALHQHTEGQHVFPLQMAVLLSEPGTDFTGGEFVMTEQRPRMQSRPMVLPLRQGDATIVSVAHRPVAGAAGPYRVNLRHAISRVRSGERIGVQLLFHDAPGL